MIEPSDVQREAERVFGPDTQVRYGHDAATGEAFASAIGKGREIQVWGEPALATLFACLCPLPSAP